MDARTWFLWNSERTLRVSALSSELSAQLRLAFWAVAPFGGVDFFQFSSAGLGNKKSLLD